MSLSFKSTVEIPLSFLVELQFILFNIIKYSIV